MQLSRQDEQAVDLFRQGSEMERLGDLDGAIKLYRKAFNINTHVDLLLRRLGTEAASTEDLTTAVALKHEEVSVEPESPSNTGDEDQEDKGDLEPGVLDQLPKEILVYILAQLAVDSPRSFVNVLLSGRIWYFPPQSSLFWAHLCQSVWPSDSTAQLQRYGTYYRQFRERPAVRFDGVYISTVKYTRIGEQRNGQWLAPVLEVRYYRYILLEPNGEVRTLLSNDPPDTVLAGFVADRNYRRALHGVWSLDEDKAMLTLETEGTTNLFSLRLEFKIASSGGKVHNKLKWHQYLAYEPPDEYDRINIKGENSFYFYKL